MNKKRLIILICIVAVLVLGIVLWACSPKGDPDPTPTPTPSTSPSTSPSPAPEFFVNDGTGSYTEPVSDLYTVEFGGSFSVPEARLSDGTVATASITDASGNAVTIQYGMARPTKAGDYSLTYVAGEKSVTVILRCQDTVAPEISVKTQTRTAAVGDVINIPYYTAKDKADIDFTRTHIMITAPDGTSFKATGDTLELEQAGEYTFTINVYDKNGVLATEVLKTRVQMKFVDESANTYTLYDFDQSEYTELLFDIDGKKAPESEIVTEGYPAIAGEADGNGVLALYDPDSTATTMQDLYVRLRLHTNWTAGDNQAGAIKIRFAVSTRTDYLHILRDDFLCARFNVPGGIEPNVWHELVLDPGKWGFFRDLDGVILRFRDKGQTTLYIDEITYVPYEWNDTLSGDVLGDFDEAGYMEHVFQNVYNDPTTTTSYCVDGTTFTHMTSGYPEPNAGTLEEFAGLGATGGVMKFETEYLYGGINYFFPRRVMLDEIESITVRFYSEEPQPLAWVFGFLDGDSCHLGHTSFVDCKDFPLGSGKPSLDNPATKFFEGNQWYEVSFTAEELAFWTGDGMVTGIFIQNWPQKYYTPGVDQDRNVMYLDEIRINA